MADSIWLILDMSCVVTSVPSCDLLSALLTVVLLEGGMAVEGCELDDSRMLRSVELVERILMRSGLGFCFFGLLNKGTVFGTMFPYTDSILC